MNAHPGWAPRLLITALLLGAAALAHAAPTAVTYDARGNVAQVCAPRGCLEGGQMACGTIDNNCFGSISCSCPAGAQWSCGGSNLCVCTPQSCAAQGKNCGTIPDGCGGTPPSCGTCPAGQVCSASNVCVCQPTTCGALGYSCGSVSNGCGGTLSCGTCSPGIACKAGTCVATCAKKICKSPLVWDPDACKCTL